MADLDKVELRLRMRAVRRGMPEAELAGASQRIADRVLGLAQAAHSEAWFVYVSVGHEVRTRELIQRLWAGQRRVAAPCVTGPGQMAAVEIACLAELTVGPLGVPAPRYDPARVLSPQVCLVPGLAFTPQGDRLGGGAGYYDRWLARHRPACVIGLAFDAQVVPTLPVEPHDQRMDLLVTESRVIDCRTGSCP